MVLLVRLNLYCRMQTTKIKWSPILTGRIWTELWRMLVCYSVETRHNALAIVISYGLISGDGSSLRPIRSQCMSTTTENIHNKIIKFRIVFGRQSAPFKRIQIRSVTSRLQLSMYGVCTAHARRHTHAAAIPSAYISLLLINNVYL